uniref:N4BP1 C-terminal UBA domain-containing protein n=1 Tax=Oncorhynchus kisutch TaxID=8019 RepID=A0A8C7CPG6_ONCKI
MAYLKCFFLMFWYTFVGDHFMVPDDPLGREGPHLDDFLRSLSQGPDRGPEVQGQNTWCSCRRSAAETSRLRESLSQVFPGQDSIVTLVLQCNPTHGIIKLVMLNFQ